MNWCLGHESLRTRFVVENGEARRAIDPPSAGILRRISLAEHDVESREAALMDQLSAIGARPIELMVGPIFHATLFRLGPTEHVLFLVMHHIVSDAWSMGVIRHDLSILYGAFNIGGRSPLPALELHYADYAAWEQRRSHREALGPHLSYWRRHLTKLPNLALPTDRPRSARRSAHGRTHAFVLGRPLADALRTLGRRENSTLFMVLLGAFGAALCKWSGQTDLAVGVPVAHRPRSETETIVGFFINTLVMRLNLAGKPDVRALLARVREEALGAYTHADVRFEQLVDVLNPTRARHLTPLFQVMLIVQNAPDSVLALEGLQVEALPTDRGVAWFDLTLMVLGEQEDLPVRLQYSTELFDEATVKRFAETLRALLDAMVAERDLELPDAGLIAPDAGAEPEPVVDEAPCSADEKTIARVWSEILQVEHIQRRDNFFALGGHSINASRIAARLAKEFDLDVHVSLIFEAPTVEELAARILNCSSGP